MSNVARLIEKPVVLQHQEFTRILVLNQSPLPQKAAASGSIPSMDGFCKLPGVGTNTLFGACDVPRTLHQDVDIECCFELWADMHFLTGSEGPRLQSSPES